MRTRLHAMIVIALLVLPPLQAQDAKAIIEKAIQATGLPKQGMAYHETWDEKGTMHAMGMKMPYDSTWSFEAPDKYRFDMKGNFGGQNIELVFIQNGKKAKESMTGQSRMVEGAKLEETTHAGYLLWVISLRPLVSDKEFKLTFLGADKFGDRDVQSVKVQREGNRDVTLHFEKSTGLLAGCTTKTKNEFENWKEVTQETILSDYEKGSNGEMQFMSMIVKNDGKLLLESKFSNFKRTDKLQSEKFKID